MALGPGPMRRFEVQLDPFRGFSFRQAKKKHRGEKRELFFLLETEKASKKNAIVYFERIAIQIGPAFLFSWGLKPRDLGNRGALCFCLFLFYIFFSACFDSPTVFWGLEKGLFFLQGASVSWVASEWAVYWQYSIRPLGCPL